MFRQPTFVSVGLEAVMAVMVKRVLSPEDKKRAILTEAREWTRPGIVAVPFQPEFITTAVNLKTTIRPRKSSVASILQC
jgi:hypothetical protein